MKKRILCLALALCLVAGLLPMTTLAADAVPYEASIRFRWYDNTAKTGSSTTKTLKSGMTPLYGTTSETGMFLGWADGELEEYNIKLEYPAGGTPKITLNSFYIDNDKASNSGNDTLTISCPGSITIECVGTNEVLAQKSHISGSTGAMAMELNGGGTFTFTGSGTFTLGVGVHKGLHILNSTMLVQNTTFNVNRPATANTRNAIEIDGNSNLIVDNSQMTIYNYIGHAVAAVGTAAEGVKRQFVVRNGSVVEMTKDNDIWGAVNFSATTTDFRIENSTVEIHAKQTCMSYAPYLTGCYTAQYSTVKAGTSGLKTWTKAPGESVSKDNVWRYFKVSPKAHTAEATYVPAAESNCTEQGNTAYYICEHGTYYSDAALMNPIEEGSWLLPLGDHIPQEDDGDPTTAVLCDKCGEVVVEAQAPAAPPSFDQSQVIAGTDLTLNFRVDKEAVIAAGGTQVKIERNGVAQEQMIPLTDAMVKDGHYVIGFEGIAAKEMGDEIAMTVCNAAGEAISVTRQDSVLQYALRMLEKDTLEGYSAEKFAKLKTLLVDMLTYGAMAQELFGYNTDNSVLDALTEEQKQLGTQQMAACTNAKATVTPEEGFAADIYQGTSFILNYKIDMAIRMSAEMGEGSYASVTFTNYLGQKLDAKTVNATALSDGTFAYSYDGLVAADGRCLVEWTFYKADGTKVATVVDSMEQYVGRNTVTLPYLAQLINYSDAAKAYFTAV